MKLDDIDVVVIGAGISGLAAASALARRSAKVTVLEQADAIREVGAGLQISPNGARVLTELGLGTGLAAIGQRSNAVELVNGETGMRVARLPLDDGVFRFVHRADLIGLLEASAREAGVVIRTGQKVTGVALGGSGPVVAVAGMPVLRPRLVIGADGLHSAVRLALNGRTAPFFTHQVAWRALLQAEGPIEPVARVHMGRGRHLVSYPLRGGTVRNIVAVEERRTWAEESWSLTDSPDALRAAFRDFSSEVRGWLDRVEAPNLWGLFRHPVPRHWHGKGAVLVGDAAHPMLPFLAQGANIALEDAWVLAEALVAHGTTDDAFAAYRAARIQRVSRVVAAAGANARNYHMSGVRRTVGHAGLRVISRLRPQALTGRFDWLYGHDVTLGPGR